MSNLSKQFQGLPIEQLISAPLLGAARAQGQLASITEDFITKVGMETDENGNLQAKMVKFKYNLPVVGKDNKMEMKSADLEVPFLSIVNVPSLCVKKINVDFNMEVKNSSKDVSESSAKGSFEAKINYGIFSARVSGSVSASSKSERTSDNSAKYSVSVEARDDGMPEGLSKVLDILSSSIPKPSEVMAMHQANEKSDNPPAQ